MESNTQLAVAKPDTSLIAQMAARYGLAPTKFMETVQKTIMPNGVAVEQVAAFLVVANQYNLNPFTKEIYAFPSKGGITPIVSVDGWATVINRQPTLDGIEFHDNLVDGKIASITCRIYRKDRAKPVEVTEYLSECRKNTEPWQKWPARMLRHKALVQCARYAFALTGIYDPDEAERIDSVDGSSTAKAATELQMKNLKDKYTKKEEPETIEATFEEPATEQAREFIDG